MSNLIIELKKRACAVTSNNNNNSTGNNKKPNNAMAFPATRALKRICRPKKGKLGTTILELVKKNRQILEEAEARGVASYTRISSEDSEASYTTTCDGAAKILQPYVDPEDLPEPAILVFERMTKAAAEAAAAAHDDGCIDKWEDGPSAYYLAGPVSPSITVVLYCTTDRKAPVVRHGRQEIATNVGERVFRATSEAEERIARKVRG